MIVNALLVFAVVFITNLLASNIQALPDPTFNLLFWAAIMSLLIGFSMREVNLFKKS